MIGPRVFRLDEFKNGQRILSYTESGGTVQHQTKDGVVDVAYGPGSLVLFNDLGVIAGPLNIEGARDLADRVLDGDSRAITDPRTLTLLAMAVTGWLVESPVGEAAAAALELEAAHV